MLVLLGPAYVTQCRVPKAHPRPGLMQHPLLSRGCPALCPGAVAQSPGREAALAWASLAQRFPASSVLAGQEQAAGVWET